MEGSHYDGIADWYDGEFQTLPLESETWHAVLRLLDGERQGALIDVGCGTGSYAAGLTERGWEVTGVDASEDMLRRAQEKGVHAIRADAASLPLGDSSFDGAISVFTHTDVDDFRAVVGEIARVLRPATPFVYVGAHPCFVGPHSTYDTELGLPEFHTGWYRRVGRYTEAPGISKSSGLRMRVGANHLPPRPLPTDLPRRRFPTRANRGARGA
ncbi:MAG TPA: class I SAM-dependent methyltransferase [Gaiellaceae bacterium]|nr:class I SAM-dependent methyltransferase [Gaiellaceae bacterium]